MKNTIYSPEKCFYLQKQKNMKDLGGKKLISKNSLIFILASLICLAGVVYVFQINKMATMGYEIKEKENKIKELNEQSEQLEIKAAQLRSIYISQIQMQEEQNQKGEDKTMAEGENKDKESEMNKEKNQDSFLTSMKKPTQISFLEVEVEKAIAMK